MTWKLERNGGKLTDRDQRLLAGLGVLLILAGSWFYVLRPLKARIQAAREDIPIQEELKILNENKLVLLSSQKTLAETNAAAFDRAAERFFPRMESEQIGRYVTDIALQNGLTALSMSITMPTEPGTVAPYIYAPAPDGNSPAEKDAPEEDGILYIAHVSMQLRGGEKALQAMLDQLLTRETSLRVTSFSREKQATQTADGVTAADTLRVELDIYMIDGK